MSTVVVSASARFLRLAGFAALLMGTTTLAALPSQAAPRQDTAIVTAAAGDAGEGASFRTSDAGDAGEGNAFFAADAGDAGEGNAFFAADAGDAGEGNAFFAA